MNHKILIIPDVHGRTFWKTALNTGEYEKVIFLWVEYKSGSIVWSDWQELAQSKPMPNTYQVVGHSR